VAAIRIHNRFISYPFLIYNDKKIENN